MGQRGIVPVLSLLYFIFYFFFFCLRGFKGTFRPRLRIYTYCKDMPVGGGEENDRGREEAKCQAQRVEVCSRRHLYL